MRLTSYCFALCALLIAVLPITARAELRVDVTQGAMNPIPTAIPDFAVGAGGDAQLATLIPSIIRNDLDSSGLFKILPPSAYIQDPNSLQAGPRFPEWRAINAQALVGGQIVSAGGQMKVEYRLYDVFSQTQMNGMSYNVTPQNVRRIAHIIADDIFKRITGEDGYFDTRIVYIAESGARQGRTKRLAIMDQDGANNKYLTDGSDLVLTPRFSPNEQMITYMSYRGGKPQVYIYDLNSGQQSLVGNFPGMTFAPRFSPDGRSLIMSLARNGSTDLYVMDLNSRQPRQLTSSKAIDTAPSYSPDGNQIVFESDRGGTQQLYVMSARGGEAKRITFGNGRYANPVWSPRGDLIAFVKMQGGKFYVGVIRPDGSGERLINSAYHVEGPTWAPNGRYLAYFKETPSPNGRSATLYSIDLTGSNERRLNTPGDGSDPAWSPLHDK
ncbi:MAG: Tol-Pal system beta propeller repeat protein TolB [Pseudobdellovibrionaceae bacterium]